MSKLKELGIAIRAIRVAANENLENVAEAVEVPLEHLEEIEAGSVTPSEQVLEMLISHFSLRDGEASRLWELAGDSYREELNMTINKSENDDNKEINVNIPSDNQILYTDMMHVSKNKYGVVISFIQGLGPAGKATVVSRIGMSIEHARSMLEVLKKSLEQETN